MLLICVWPAVLDEGYTLKEVKSARKHKHSVNRILVMGPSVCMINELNVSWLTMFKCFISMQAFIFNGIIMSSG